MFHQTGEHKKKARKQACFSIPSDSSLEEDEWVGIETGVKFCYYYSLNYYVTVLSIANYFNYL